MTLIAGLAVAIIFVSGILLGTIPLITASIGGVLALAGWVYAVLIAARMRQTGWITMLVIGLVASLALAFYAYSQQVAGVPNDNLVGVMQLGMLPLALIGLSYGTLGSAEFLQRGSSSFYGGWGLLALVLGGTLVGGAIGTSIGAGAAYITSFGFRLYAVAGLLALIAWINGLIVGIQTKSWGWFTMVLLLPGIGAFMFGLFGPTRQDVLMAQEHARQRKAVGLG